MLSTGILLKIKFSKFLQTHFMSPIPIRMKKIAPPSLVCHGLPENASQVNQLYNVTWSNRHMVPNKRIGGNFFSNLLGEKKI